MTINRARRLSRTTTFYVKGEPLCEDFSIKEFSLKCTLITRNTYFSHCKVVIKNKSNDLIHSLSLHPGHSPHFMSMYDVFWFPSFMIGTCALVNNNDLIQPEHLCQWYYGLLAKAFILVYILCYSFQCK